MFVTKRSGERQPLDLSKYERQIEWSCEGLEGVSAKKLKQAARRPLIDGISTKELSRNITVAAAELISKEEPNWTFVAARCVLLELFKSATGTITYPHLKDYLANASTHSKVDPALTFTDAFDLEVLNAAINPTRDFLFDYLGIQTLADRYLLRAEDGKRVLELPQHFLMRVAMGVALAEDTKDSRTSVALNYYSMLSNLEFLSSTPTLFNSGTTHPQLSSCFGSQMGDSLDSIMGTLTEMAQYSKMAGGCSMDVGGVRAKGSRIKSTGGKAGGPIPYIHTYDSVLRGFDQSGKRKGSGSFYIEPWHPDVFEYLKLKDEGGDPRLRAHDAFPAFMIPDLFMKRVREGGYWSLFCPNDAKGLHESYGDEFEKLYTQYEAAGIARQVLPAEDLWHAILTKTFQKGVYWPCFKDTINYRYPQVETGMVNHSNLCTEICLRDSVEQDISFVCNLGSLNLSRFKFEFKDGKLVWNRALEVAVRHAIRFLDSVVTIGSTPHQRGRKFQDQDRAIGLGVMGWTVALTKLGIDYESADHVSFANEVYKQISITATHASAELAREKGSYPTFAESTWAKGLLIQDTLRHRGVVEQFGLDIETTNCPFTTFDELRELVKGGMRNSCLMAIAPTATIANIAGTSQCTEAAWDLESQKENLSGEFKVFAPTLLHNPFGLVIKAARDLDHRWTVRAAAARQIWIDQAQSTNFFIDPNRMNLEELGEYMDDLYMLLWELGGKTSYYVYSQSAIKQTVVPSQPGPALPFNEEEEGPACYLRPGDEGFADCEACQ